MFQDLQQKIILLKAVHYDICWLLSHFKMKTYFE